MAIAALITIFAFGVFSLVVVIGLAAAIKHKRWGWLAAGFGAVVALPIAAVLASFVAVPVAPVTVPQPSLVGVPLAVPPQPPKIVEPVATPSIEAIAAAAPKIRLDDTNAASPQNETASTASDTAGEAEPTAEPADAAAASADASEETPWAIAAAKTDPIPVASPDSPDRVVQDTTEGESTGADRSRSRPDWIDGDLNANQEVIVAGPFTTRSGCRTQTAEQVADWVERRLGGVWPDRLGPMPVLAIDLEKITKAEHSESRETSVGEVFLLYTLVELDDEVREELTDRVRQARAAAQQRVGVRVVAVGGASLLAAVGMLHVALRAGPRRPVTPTAGA